MDALSSQATVGGYKAALLAAERLPKFFPMLMTAAGTVPPAKVLVISEEATVHWARRRDALGLKDNVELLARPFKGRATGAEWRQFVTAVAALVHERRPHRDGPGRGDRHLGGVPVEILVGDDQTKPDIARQLVDKMIEQDKVDIITGMLNSSVLLAIARPALDAGKIVISSIAGP